MAGVAESELCESEPAVLPAVRSLPEVALRPRPAHDTSRNPLAMAPAATPPAASATAAVAPADAVFDAIVQAAAQACNAPIAQLTAQLSPLDEPHHYWHSTARLAGAHRLPRGLAFCEHLLRDDGLFEIGDAAVDARFAASALVGGEPSIRFYAGLPITLPDGERAGSLCVISPLPNRLSPAQRSALHGLARIAGAALHERRRAGAAMSALQAGEAAQRALVDAQAELISMASPDGTLTFVNAAYARHCGLHAGQMIGRNRFDFVAADERAALREHLQSVGRQTRVVTSVDRSVAADGRASWVCWNNRPVFDDAGELMAIQSVGRDVTEQRVAEEALAFNEQRYRTLYKSTPAVLHSLDAEGRIVTVSNRWLEWLGYTRQAVVGRLLTDFMTAESAARARQPVLQAATNAGRCARAAYQFVHAAGHLLEVLLSAHVEFDAAGAPLRQLAVIDDITETRRIADELSRMHTRLDAIVDNVPALIGHWDADGVTRFANREFQAAFGQPLDSMIGLTLRTVCEVVDAEIWAVLGPRVDAVLRGKRQDFELAMLTTSGLRQLRVSLVPDQPRDGYVAGYYGMAHDITGRKALELRLGESELRYRSLFDNLNSGFALHEIVVDAQGRPVDYKFLAMNGAFSTMTGLQPVSSIGRCISEVMPGIVDDPADWIGVYGSVALSGVARHFEQRSAPLDRWFEVVAYRPAPGQFAVVTQDITQRKAAQGQLQDALHEKETLLKEVYHRVKNNLQVVQSLLNLQRRGLAEGPARVALADSVQRVRAMALVHEKLYQSGSLASVTLADYTLDLLKQIDEATGASGRQIRLSGAVAPLQTNLDCAIPFGLLVTELVSNALKHAFNGGAAGEIRVTLEAGSGGALLTVSDDGCGLPDGFDVAAATASMGLQLAASLASQLGGTLVAAAATPGHAGSRFSATLTRL